MTIQNYSWKRGISSSKLAVLDTPVSPLEPKGAKLITCLNTQTHNVSQHTYTRLHHNRYSMQE